jgi:hypothetical protein
LAADDAWCDASRTQSSRASRTIDSGRYRAQVAGECYSDWKADQARSWREASKRRGTVMCGIDEPTVAAKGKPMMRVTFVRRTDFNDFEYGYVQPHPSGDVRRDSNVVCGVELTEALARSMAGRLV